MLVAASHVPPAFVQSASVFAAAAPAKAGPVKANARVIANIEMRIFMAFSPLLRTKPQCLNALLRLMFQEHPILSRIESMSAGQIGEQHPAFVAEPNLMAIINGLIVAVFLILVVASVAVVGSMIVLTLFDLALSRKRPSGTTAVIDSDPEITNRSNLEMAFSNWRRERGATEED